MKYFQFVLVMFDGWKYPMFGQVATWEVPTKKSGEPILIRFLKNWGMNYMWEKGFPDGQDSVEVECPRRAIIEFDWVKLFSRLLKRRKGAPARTEAMKKTFDIVVEIHINRKKMPRGMPQSEKIKYLTNEAIINQKDLKFHKNDLVYTKERVNVLGHPGTDDMVLAVVGPGNYPEGLMVRDLLVGDRLLTLPCDFKGRLTRKEGIAFYLDGIGLNDEDYDKKHGPRPRWTKVQWRDSPQWVWGRLQKRRTRTLPNTDISQLKF